MKKPNLPNVNDLKKKVSKHIQDIESLDDIKKLPEKLDNKTYAGITLASGIAMCASAMIKPLRPLTIVFQSVAVASSGFAESNIEQDRLDADKHYKDMKHKVASSVFAKGGLAKKAIKDLTDEDAVRLSMCSDLQIGRLNRALAAEALKVQITMDVHDGFHKNPHFNPVLTHIHKADKTLRTDKGVELLLQERDSVRDLKNSPVGNGPIEMVAKRVGNARMLSNILNRSKSTQKIAKKVGKTGKFLSNAFLIQQTVDAVKTSGKIMRNTPMPRFKNMNTFVEYNLARFHQAEDTLMHVKDGIAGPVGTKGLFNKPK